MSGFYKRDGDTVLHGPNFVLNRDYELHADTHGDHDYPVDGWYWFDSDDEAYAFFDLPLPVPYEPDDPYRRPGDRL
jgi:hypothetical protein